MKHSTMLLVALLACLTASNALAGETLSIRLVEASNEGPGNLDGIEDVIRILKKSSSHEHFALIASATQSLPAKGQTSKLRSLAIKCKGKQGNVTITVKSGRKQLLNTTVALKDGTPIVVGGFPSRKGKMILVFLAR